MTGPSELGNMGTPELPWVGRDQALLLRGKGVKSSAALPWSHAGIDAGS